MKTVPIPLAQTSDRHQSRLVDSQTLVNCYIEYHGPHRTRAATIQHTPGTQRVATLQGAGRGLWSFNGYLHAVYGTRLYRVTHNFQVEELGRVVDDGAPVMMFDNGRQLGIQSGPHLYAYTEANGLEVTQDPNVSPIVAADWIDQYAIIASADGGFGVSKLFSIDEYDPTEIAFAERKPDPITTLIVHHNEVLVAGSDSIEVWVVTDDLDFPLERVREIAIDLGVAGRHSIANVPMNQTDHAVVFLASDLTVRMMSGYQPVRVSTHGIETEISRWAATTGISDCVAVPYSSRGHHFVAFNFPAAGATRVYDTTTGRWHDRGYESAWSVRSALQFRGENLAADSDGGLFRMSDDVYLEDGAKVRRIADAPPIVGAHRLAMSRLEIDVETVDHVDDEAPSLEVSWSDDGGSNYHPAREVSLASAGARSKRVSVRRLGAFEGVQGRRFRFVLHDDAPFSLSSASARVHMGPVL